MNKKLGAMNIRTGLVRSAFFILLGIALVALTAKSYGQLIAPFESINIDEELAIEYWMTVSFEADQETEVEDWMASIWF
jgi:hypothetical protein